MKNSIFLLAAITLAFLMTSCSDESSLGMSNEDSDQTSTALDVDPETGEKRRSGIINMEDVMADAENQHIDLTDIIIADAAKNEKEENAKSISTRIFNDVIFISHGGWYTVKHYTKNMGNCYKNYRVTIIPEYGDPDVSIWGYDHSRHNKYRKVRGATSYLGYGKEETWYKKCDFGYYEEKGIIGVFADQNRSTKFRIVIDRIS